MTTNHTPGPWKWDQPSVFNTAGIPIAHIFNHLDPKEKEANARLIASAPELLEALKILVGDFKSDNPIPFTDGITIAKAAIAKAEGRE